MRVHYGLIVDHQVECTRSHRAERSYQDVLRHAGHGVQLSIGGRPEEDVDRLLERSLVYRTCLVSINAVASDGHHGSSGGHRVDEGREMAIVDVAPVELDDSAHLLEQGIPARLDAQHAYDLENVVAHRPGVVDIDVRHDLHEVDALCVQHPFLACLEGSLLLVVVGDLGLPQENLANVFDSLKLDERQEAGLDLLDEGELLVLLHVVIKLCGHALHARVVDHPDAENEFLGIVIVVDAVQLRTKVFHDDVRHVGQEELLVDHHVPGELDAQEPRAEDVGVDLAFVQVEVALHPVLVVLDHGRLRVRVVVDLCGVHDPTEVAVLEGALDRLRRLLSLGWHSYQVHRQRRRPDVLRHIDDLREARHSQRDILRRYSSKMERIQRHLRRRFPDALRGNRSHCLTRGCQRRHEALLDFAYDLLEGPRVELVLGKHALGREGGAHEGNEQQGSV